MSKNEIERLVELANWLHGYAAATKLEPIIKAARAIEKLADNICGQGYIRCLGGPDCDSNHK